LLSPQKNTKFIIAKGPSKIEDIYLKHKEGETTKWDLTSEVAYIEEKRNMIDLEGITMNINEGDGIAVRGKKGTVDEKEKTIVLQDSVVIEMKDYILYTDSLTYNSNKRAVTTEDDVRLEGKDLLITGRGLYANIEKERVKIRKNVVATLY